jgi:Fe-S cluster biogenesis protein NfuA
MAAPHDLRATGDRIEQLLDELQAAALPRIYEKAEEALRLVTELYGAGLARVCELVGPAAPELLDQMAADPLVSALLLVHDLHPESLVPRLETALAKVRPLLASHGGDVELLDVDEAAAAVRIRLLGSCDGCPSSAVTLQSAVERAILEAAPEIVTIDVDEPSKSVGIETPVSLGSKPVFEECPAEMAQA